MKVFRGTPSQQASKLGIWDVLADDTDEARDIARNFYVSVKFPRMNLPRDAWEKHDVFAWKELADDQHKYSDDDLEGEARILRAPVSKISD